MKVTRKFFAVLLSLCLLISLFAGCQSEQDRLYSEALGSQTQSDEESKAESDASDGSSTGTLVIEEIIEPAGTILGLSFYGMGLCFAEENPGVTVESSFGISIEDFRSGDYAALMSQYFQEMAVRMMSGEGPDILAGFGYSFEKYAQSGMLVDLAPYIEADEDFRKEDYFYNVIEGCMVDGALYAMPINTIMNLVCFDPQIAEGVSDVLPDSKELSAEEMLAAYEAAEERELIPADYDFSFRDESVRRIYLEEKLSSRFSITERKAELTDDNFISYLESMKALPTEETWMGGSFTGNLGQFRQEGGSFLFSSPLNLDYKDTPDTDIWFPRNFFDDPSMFITKDDEGATLKPVMFMAVTSSCENPELAWEFIKYTIGETGDKAINTYYTSDDGDTADTGAFPMEVHLNAGFPIHKGNAREYLTQQMGTEGVQYDRWEEYLSGAKVGYTFNSGSDYALYEIVEEVLGEYYDTDLLTAEQCAAKLQDRLYIYVNE